MGWKETKFKTTVSRDLLGIVFGKRLGRGMSRQVYEFLPNPKLVIKVELYGRAFQNILEYEFWEQYKHAKEIRPWLAPVHRISSCGIYMLQERTASVERNELPASIPKWITDEKTENWGRIGKRFVLHDYAYTLANLPLGMKKRRAGL